MKKRRKAILPLLLLIALTALSWQFVYREKFVKPAYPTDYSALIGKYARLSGLDPDLVYAVVRSESGFNPRAKSRVGALGLMQLTPETFDWAQSKTVDGRKYQTADLYNPEINIKYGTQVLATLLIEYQNTGTALAAYHAGRTNVRKWLSEPRCSPDGRTLSYIPFADTRAYVKKVADTRKIYRELYQ